MRPARQGRCRETGSRLEKLVIITGFDN